MRQPHWGRRRGADCSTNTAHIETLWWFPGVHAATLPTRQSLTWVTSNILTKAPQAYVYCEERRKQLLDPFSLLIHSSEPG